MDFSGQRTENAAAAVKLGEYLEMMFASLTYGTQHPLVVKAITPEGPSTGGGVTARDSIMLRPAEGNGPEILCGWIDVPRKCAELRDFSLVQAQFKRRHGHAFAMEPQEYARLLKDLRKFMMQQKIDVEIADLEAVPVAVAAKPEPEAINVTPYLAVAFVALVGVYAYTSGLIAI